MSHRERKSNKYVISTYFPFLLQNCSSGKRATIENFQPGSVRHLPEDIMSIQYHRRRSGVSFFFFFNYGDQTSPNFLKIHFKRVALELPTAICKREESGIHGRGPFPLGVSLPALDEGVDRLSTKAFLPWSDFAAYWCRKPPHPSHCPIMEVGWRCTKSSFPS